MDITTTAPAKRGGRHPFRRTVLAGVAVAVLIAGEFAMMAVIPVTMAVVTTWRNAGLRKLRPWVTGLAGLYGLALAMWAIGPDRAESLSKDINPAVAIAISIAGLAFAAKSYLLKKEANGDY